MSGSLSSFRREGTTEYGYGTLEGNWQEERERIAVGEVVKPSMMDGARVRAEEPDISIAPPPRVPGAQSNGRLEMPHRSFRSIVTNDSSRQGADDGFREYTSMNQTFFTPIDDRERCPISIEPNFHGTWGGPIQIDGRSKTRVGPENRSKNVQYEPNLLADGEQKMTRKMINLSTFKHTQSDRPLPGNTDGGFGSVLPKHPTNISERMLTSTAMASFSMQALGH